MSKMNRIILPIFLLLIAVSSCTVYQNYPIDVYEPGEINIPPTAENVALVYRNFKYPTDTLQHYYKEDFSLVEANDDPTNLDSIMVTANLTELANKLMANNSFQNIQFVPYNVFQRHTSENLPALDFEIVTKLTDATGADLLISLETFSYFYSSYPETQESIAFDEVITAAVWGIYDPAEEHLIERKTMIDTVVWHAYDEQGNFNRNYQPPSRFAALQIASALAGDNYSRRFYASWETVNRTYSIPPLPDFSDAAYYFEEGEWDTAIALWERYADESNGKMAINARYNIALAYEIKDEIDVAIQWLDAARDLAVQLRSEKELNRIFEYRNILINRKEKLDQLIQE